jgi:HEAT repeat protein
MTSRLLGFALIGPIALASGCARSVNDYLAEASGGSPVSVREAVVAIGGILYRKEASGIAFDKADEGALLYVKDVASSREAVPINRAAAIRALGRLRKAAAADIHLSALSDPFWLVRLEAVRALGVWPEERFSGPLRERLTIEPRPEVRLEIVKVLGKVKGPLAVRTLLEVFLDRTDGSRDPQVQAFLALREMTGLTYTFDEVEKWKGFYVSLHGEEPPARILPDGAPGEAKKPAEAKAPAAAPAPPPAPAGGPGGAAPPSNGPPAPGPEAGGGDPAPKAPEGSAGR